MKCPNCQSKKVLDRTDIYKEPRQPVYDFECETCNYLFNDEDD